MLQPERHEEGTSALQPFADNFIPAIPTDYATHTEQHPNCSDRYDTLKDELQQYCQDGLVSADDATRILEGRQIWQ
jgi:hypothetical protein